MNIDFNRFFKSTIIFSKEKFTSILTVRQAKVLTIALAVFVGLTAAYLLARRCFGKKVLQIQGPLVKGKLNGQGKLVFSDGTIWQGEFKDSVLHGKGEKIGSKQEERGHFDRGCLIKGTLQIGKERWKGSFRNGKLHGKGSFLVDSKEMMVGEFKDGKLHGSGKAIRFSRSSKKIVEEGEFLEGKLHGKGVRIYPSGVRWDSHFSQGVASGAGKIVYPGGSTEVGEFKDNCFFKGVFKNGKLTGLGKVINKDGEIWEGDFEEGRLKKGKKVCFDGTVWEGEFDHNPQLNLQSQKLCGNGKIINPQGDIKQGQFKYGLLHGPGKMTFKHGKIYEGEFKSDMLHGLGKMTFSDGRIHKGEFLWDLLHGKGQEINKKGQIIKDGQFEYGVLIQGKMAHFVKGAVAEGLFEYSDNNKKIYLKGKLQYSTGQILEGEIIEGRLLGRGKITLPNQSVWEGEFKNHNDLIEGKVTFTDGTIWEGEFDNHLLHGEGKIIFPDGRKWEGEFKKGNLIRGKKFSKDGHSKNYVVNSASSPNT